MWTCAFKFQTHCELVADHVGCPFSISSVNLDWPLLRPLFLAPRTLIHAHCTLVLLPCTCTWDAFIWFLGRTRIQAQCRYLWYLPPISDISRQDPELLLEMFFFQGGCGLSLSNCPLNGRLGIFFVFFLLHGHKIVLCDSTATRHSSNCLILSH